MKPFVHVHLNYPIPEVSQPDLQSLNYDLGYVPAWILLGLVESKKEYGRRFTVANVIYKAALEDSKKLKDDIANNRFLQ
jgi:hypothetical protein